MINSLFVFLGAGLGGVCRYKISNAIYSLIGHVFPYGTLAVNVTGCFLAGFLSALLLGHFNKFLVPLHAFLFVGFLGGYTTFSAFSIDTLTFFEKGAGFNAFLNIMLNIGLSIAATWIGIITARQL